jgi:predicted phosphodiesterase
MRIAIVSDVHGNLTALEAVLADLRLTSPDVIWHGGDLAANGAHPAEVVDRIRDLGWPGVLGNTDEMLAAPETLSGVATRFPQLQSILTAFAEMIPTTRAWLGDDRIRWLQTLPHVLRQGPLALVHASPNELWRAPLPQASDAELQSVYGALAEAPADSQETSVDVYAHIHRPYIRSLDKLTVANTGSLSLSYDGDPRASYLLLDGTTATIRRLDYDLQREAQALLHSGLPRAPWLCHILRTARFHPPASS